MTLLGRYMHVGTLWLTGTAHNTHSLIACFVFVGGRGEEGGVVNDQLPCSA